MDPWWWVPIGLAAWSLVAVVMGLCIGSVLKRSSETRESLDQQSRETSGGHVTPGPVGAAPYTLKRNSTTSPSRMT